MLRTVLQNYVDITSDIQTAAYIAAYTSRAVEEGSDQSTLQLRTTKS
jgi:hypothetical protein